MARPMGREDQSRGGRPAPNKCLTKMREQDRDKPCRR